MVPGAAWVAFCRANALRSDVLNRPKCEPGCLICADAALRFVWAMETQR